MDGGQSLRQTTSRSENVNRTASFLRSRLAESEFLDITGWLSGYWRVFSKLPLGCLIPAAAPEPGAPQQLRPTDRRRFLLGSAPEGGGNTE
jgi:hypothetical protein